MGIQEKYKISNLDFTLKYLIKPGEHDLEVNTKEQMTKV